MKSMGWRGGENNMYRTTLNATGKSWSQVYWSNDGYCKHTILLSPIINTDVSFYAVKNKFIYS